MKSHCWSYLSHGRINNGFRCLPGSMGYKWFDCITIAYEYINNETYDVPGRLIIILSYDNGTFALVHNLISMIPTAFQYLTSIKYDCVYHE